MGKHIGKLWEKSTINSNKYKPTADKHVFSNCLSFLCKAIIRQTIQIISDDQKCRSGDVPDQITG